MAQFINVHLLEHTRIITNSFTLISGKDYYKGTLTIGALSGWKFDENQLYTMRLNTPETGYKVKNATFNTDFTEITFPMYESDRINARSLERDVYFDGYLIATAEKKQIFQSLTNCTSNAPEEISSTDTEINITVSANAGFEFNTVPKISINGTNNFYFTVSSDKTSANIVFDLVSFGFDNINTFTIVATADEMPKSLEISQTLTNCTSNAPEEISSTDTEINITVSANAGFGFSTDDTPSIFIFDTKGNPRVFYFTVSNNKTSANIVFDLVSFGFDNIYTFEIIANAEILPTPPKTKTVSQSLTNCTSNAPAQILETDTKINISVSANAGFEFNETPKILVNETNIFLFAVSSNKTSANIVFDLVSFGFDNINTFEIVATADAIPIPPKTKTVSQSLTNCTSNAPAQILETDTEINITVSANPNAIFETVPKVFIIDGLGNPQQFLFEVSSNKTSANIVFDLVSFGFDNIYTFEIIANATIITPYADKYGTINVYSVTDANLNDFAKQRFFKEITSETNDFPQYENVDLGKYVASLKRVYFNAGETVDNVLKCGNYTTNINVKTPLNDTIIINCGFVEIPNYNNNIVDYETEINLFLPFVGFVSLPSDYIGKTIYLQYVCNLIAADAIAKLICDNVVISVAECNLSNDLIYKTSDTQNEFNKFGAIGFNMHVLKGLQPFANIKHFDALSTLYNNECVRLKLSEIEGFAKVDEITDLNVNAIESEKDLILSMLSNGVIF